MKIFVTFWILIIPLLAFSASPVKRLKRIHIFCPKLNNIKPQKVGSCLDKSCSFRYLTSKSTGFQAKKKTSAGQQVLLAIRLKKESGEIKLSQEKGLFQFDHQTYLTMKQLCPNLPSKVRHLSLQVKNPLDGLVYWFADSQHHLFKSRKESGSSCTSVNILKAKNWRGLYFQRDRKKLGCGHRKLSF